MTLELETAYTIQAYAYVILTGICAFLLYGYIYHLYSSEKKGTRDYEKYANIALDDELDSTPIETTSPWEKKKNKGESA
jgi:cytochrome c oxidase cbb3-type subunit 4